MGLNSRIALYYQGDIVVLRQRSQAQNRLVVDDLGYFSACGPDMIVVLIIDNNHVNALH